MDAGDHRRQIEQQIIRAWQVYITACLDHQHDSARLAMIQIDRLLDLPVIPRQREPDSEGVVV
jgi:hypothetical protein